MAVRTVTPDDFECYRDIRLRALAADPGAFASTYEREAAFSDEQWRERLASINGRPALFLACTVDGDDAEAERWVGTAGIGFLDGDASPMLIGMWVDPIARGQGCAKQLIDAAVDWARAANAPDVMLWVVKDNENAIALYEGYGFVASGKVDTVPSNPCADELEMRLAL